MFQRTVKAKLMINNEEIEISISISCVPTTPERELIRRAGNILRAAANDATYEVV